MARYELTAPDGGRYEVTAPDNMPEAAVLTRFKQEIAATAPAPKPEMGWGDYLKGLGREAIQGATLDFGDELGITDRDASNQFSTEHPIASTIARIGGSLPLFAAGPGAWAAWAAMGGKSLLGNVGRSAGLGAGLGAVSGAGAGEGGPGDRIEPALTGAAVGGILGGAIPPAFAAAGRVASTAKPLMERFTRRPTEPPLPFNAYSNPVEGARFVADGAPPPAPPAPADIAGGQERMLLALRDTMLRSGKTPQEFQAMLDEAQAAARPHSSGRAQTATVLADLDEALTRQAGVFARQSPEAAREMTHVMQARQTGITPMGADEVALAQRGIPSRSRLADPITGRQAQARFGTDFGAGLANQVPMGSRDRVRDWLERLYLIKDKKHHGFGRTGIETMEQAAARADELAQANYTVARKAHALANFRTQIDDVFNAALKDAAVKEAPTVEAAIKAAHGLFRPGKPINLEQFDNIKRVLDNRIKALLDKPGTVHAGGLLNEVKNRLLTAVDDATGGAKSLYGKARADHAKEMQNMRSYLAGRNVLTEDEALRRTGPLAELIADEEAAIRHFATLNEEQQKLWRQGFVDALTAKLPRNVSRSGLQLFNEERVLKLLRETAPAESSKRAPLLGRYIDFEGRMPETKQTAVGGSSTARNVQDDLMAIATEASQNVQGIMNLLRGNQSLYQLGERLVTAAWDRAFGVGADAAREGARVLFTANPGEQRAFLQQVAARWPASRMAHFNTLMTEAQKYLSASTAIASGGALGAPTPTAGAPSGPTML